MITSVHNELIKQVVALQQRKTRERRKQYVIEGRRFVEEAVLRQASIAKIFVCPERISNAGGRKLLALLNERLLSLTEVDERVMDKLSMTEGPQGVVAVLDYPPTAWEDFFLDGEPASKNLYSWLIIDGVQDPGNLGTLLRTALAAGVTRILLTRGTVDLYNPKVLRSTMGSLFSLKVLMEQEPMNIIRQCAAAGVELIMADAGGQSLYKMEDDHCQRPLALVVGNEGNGPSPLFRQKISHKISIPMQNQVESLNVAMAAGIILFEGARRMDKKG